MRQANWKKQKKNKKQICRPVESGKTTPTFTAILNLLPNKWINYITFKSIIFYPECLCLPQFICWNLIPDVTVQRWELWGWLGLGGKALMSALVKRTPRISLPPFAMKAIVRGGYLRSRNEILTRHWACCLLDLGLLSLQDNRNKCALFKSVLYGIAVRAAWINRLGYWLTMPW